MVAAKAHLDRARRLGLAENASTSVPRDQHTAVLDALERGDREDARGLLRAHLRTVFSDIERVRSHSPQLFASNSWSVPTRRSIAVWD